MKNNKLVKSIHTKLILSIIIFAPLFYLGIGNKYPWVLLGQYGKPTGILFFFVMTIIFFAMFLSRFLNKSLPNSIQKIFAANLFLSIIFAICYDIIQYKHFLRFDYHKPILLFILSAITIILLALYRNKLKLVFAICGLYSICHYMISIYYFPLVIARSDMLAAIAVSINQFMHGISPYYQSSPIVGIPPYLPMTMLSFIPAYSLKLDFRLVGLIYWVITIGLIIYKEQILTNIQKMALCLLIVNPYFLMRHDLYYQFFLLEIVILCLYFNLFNFVAKGIFLGVFISTLQFAWILYPFILLAENKTIKNLFTMLLLSLATAILGTFLYVHHGFADFIHAIFLHKEYLLSYSSDITFGLSMIFYFAKSQILLYIFQITICLLILLGSIFAYLTNSESLRNHYMSLGAICYLIFMSTNYFIETYLLIPMLLFIILSLKKVLNTNHTKP